MSEPDISTLARRLAEQNNVEWRALSGSGPDGKVVERDVLDFLARVMAGEEATDPTPEPLPAGMEAWPDQDLDDLRSGVGASLGDLRDELGKSARADGSFDQADVVGNEGEGVYGEVESVAFGSAGTATGDATDLRQASSDALLDAAEGSDQAATSVDEDIFLFDDDEVSSDSVGSVSHGALGDGFGVGLTGAESGQGALNDLAGADDLDDLLVAGDELLGDEPSATTDEQHDVALGAAGGESNSADDTSAPYGAGDFGELSPAAFESGADDFGFEASDSSGLGTLDAEEDTAWSGNESEDEALDDTASWGSDISLGRDGDKFGSGDGATADGDADALWGEAQQSSGDDGAALWADDQADAASATEAHSPWGSAAAVGDDAEAEPLAAEGIEAAAFITDSGDAEAGDPLTAGAAEVVAAELGVTELGEGELAPDELDGDANVLAAAESAVANLPLARSATMLRRHIDLSALAAAQVSVGNELGFEEPLSVAPFLLRAVAKAANVLDVQQEFVALAMLSDGLALRRVTDAAHGSFTELVNQLTEPQVEEDEARLVAADLSGLDLDEAILDLDTPTVTLGRILYDNQRGAYRSTLTLTGDVRPDVGARLLARVAELLDAPVRLVL